MVTLGKRLVQTRPARSLGIAILFASIALSACGTGASTAPSVEGGFATLRNGSNPSTMTLTVTPLSTCRILLAPVGTLDVIVTGTINVSDPRVTFLAPQDGW